MRMSFLPIVTLFGAILLYSATAIEATKPKEKDVTYKAHVNEMGTFFDETVKDDEKEKAATYKAHGNQMEASFDESVKDDEKKKTITYHVPAHNNLDKVQMILDFKKSRLLYYNFMTPRMLLKLATYKSKSHSVTDKELRFKAKIAYGLLLRIPLVKKGVLSNRTSLTVKIVVAQNTDIGNKEDSDISYGISDGLTFMGMETTDSHFIGYKSYPPCYRIEGTSGLKLTNLKYKKQVNKDAKNSKYPGQFEITLKPSQRWGSCYIAYKSGNTWQEVYQGQLSLDRGLNLEVYNEEGNERYGIKYVAVTVMRDQY